MKQHIIIISFKPYSEDGGSLTIEIHGKEKWLTYKKDNVVRMIHLTKKSYKNLKRFSRGTHDEYYLDINDNPKKKNFYDAEGYDSYDDGCEGGWQNKEDYCLLLGIKETVKKEKALFVVQVFRWKKHE